LGEAVLFSCGANDTHGVPRTNEDKRRGGAGMPSGPVPNLTYAVDIKLITALDCGSALKSKDFEA